MHGQIALERLFDRPAGRKTLLAGYFLEVSHYLRVDRQVGFPEFTRHVRTLESQLAATILSRYPTAASFRGVSVKKLARIVYDGSHKIGEELASALIEAAAKSVGSYHSEPYRLRIKYLCEDLDVLRHRLKDLARDIERKLDDHEVGKLLTTIDGVGPLTAACLIAELGDPARFAVLVR
jgi:transposase